MDNPPASLFDRGGSAEDFAVSKSIAEPRPKQPEMRSRGEMIGRGEDLNLRPPRPEPRKHLVLKYIERSWNSLFCYEAVTGCDVNTTESCGFGVLSQLQNYLHRDFSPRGHCRPRLSPLSPLSPVLFDGTSVRATRCDSQSSSSHRCRLRALPTPAVLSCASTPLAPQVAELEKSSDAFRG
jgi:hypothetical protein